MSDIPEFSDLPAQAPGQPQANSFWDIWDTPSEPDVIEPLENNPRDIGYADESHPGKAIRNDHIHYDCKERADPNMLVNTK